MTVTPLPRTGNSSKFEVGTAKGVKFVIALSFTLRTKIWQLPDEAAELAVARQMAEAIIGRHDPILPFKSKYVFGEHNAEATLKDTLKRLHRTAV
ncbi:MAG TPA: hypothetical protein VF809_03730 [Candidatus Saccharimonadales bacterium]